MFSERIYCNYIVLKISGKSNEWLKSYSCLKIAKKPKNAVFRVTCTLVPLFIFK